MTAIASRSRIGSIVSSAKSIYVSACAAEIEDAPALFRQYRPQDAVVTGIFSPLINRRSYADAQIGLRVRSFFLTGDLKKDLAGGMVDYCPWRYNVINQWLMAPGRFDTALVMMTPPDDSGMCSLGVQADFLPSFYDKVERLVGFINRQMPRTSGDALVRYASLDTVYDYDVPLKTMIEKNPDPAVIRIADLIAELVPDGATVQFGIGQIPSQVVARLANHRGLRIHTGVVDDSVITLEASGALDERIPIVTGNAIGTARLYDAMAGSARFSFRSVGHTHSYGVVAAIDRFTAINSVLQVDLLGQANAETSGGRWIASPGGLPDFARGALGSRQGKSIIAVRAKGAGGHAGGIVPLLSSPDAVTNAAVDADVIVTEYGAVHLRDLSVDQRAEAIIAIAAPTEQQHLSEQWTAIRASGLARR